MTTNRPTIGDAAISKIQKDSAFFPNKIPFLLYCKESWLDTETGGRHHKGPAIILSFMNKIDTDHAYGINITVTLNDGKTFDVIISDNLPVGSFAIDYVDGRFVLS